MKKMKLGVWGLVAGLLFLLPQLGSAQTVPTGWTTSWTSYGGACGGATLTACVQFDLYEYADGSYVFRSEYSSNSSDPGVVTATGFYDVDTGNPPNFTFEEATMMWSPDGLNWNAYPVDPDGSLSKCNHLNGDGTVVLETCGDADGGSTNGFGPGEYVIFSFKSGSGLVAALENGDYGARAHVQSFGTADCSLKPDYREPTGGTIVSPPDGGLENCGANVVPEPATILLLATGLIGVGAVGYRNRRKDEEEQA